MYKSSETTWDVTLEKSTLGNDKQLKRTLFYRIRLLAGRSGGGYRTWTNWGTVGKQGQENLMYNDSDLDRAQQLFREKFEEKTGLPWKDRTNAPLNGYYRYIPQGKSESAESV